MRTVLTGVSGVTACLTGGEGSFNVVVMRSSSGKTASGNVTSAVASVIVKMLCLTSCAATDSVAGRVAIIIVNVLYRPLGVTLVNVADSVASM